VLTVVDVFCGVVVDEVVDEVVDDVVDDVVELVGTVGTVQPIDANSGSSDARAAASET
jgi:hypothetical protein